MSKEEKDAVMAELEMILGVSYEEAKNELRMAGITEDEIFHRFERIGMKALNKQIQQQAQGITSMYFPQVEAEVRGRGGTH